MQYFQKRQLGNIKRQQIQYYHVHSRTCQLTLNNVPFLLWKNTHLSDSLLNPPVKILLEGGKEKLLAEVYTHTYQNLLREREYVCVCVRCSFQTHSDIWIMLYRKEKIKGPNIYTNTYQSLLRVCVCVCVCCFFQRHVDIWIMLYRN